MDNAKKIIDRIRQDEITPTPRWIFTWKNGLIWLGFLLAVILGALAFSVILLAVQQTDFNIISHLSHTKLELFLGLLPFIWLIMVIVFLGLAILNIRNTRKGYKFSPFRQVSISLLISISLGTLFFLAGGSQQLERAFDIGIKNYASIEERKIKMWNLPKEGYLSGQIIQSDSQIIKLRDFDNRDWEVTYPEAFIAPILRLENGEQIKLIGKMTSENTFTAIEIRPWGGRSQRGAGRNQGRMNGNK